jgi:hypothetical protein
MSLSLPQSVVALALSLSSSLALVFSAFGCLCTFALYLWSASFSSSPQVRRQANSKLENHQQANAVLEAASSLILQRGML